MDKKFIILQQILNYSICFLGAAVMGDYEAWMVLYFNDGSSTTVSIGLTD